MSMANEIILMKDHNNLIPETLIRDLREMDKGRLIELKSALWDIVLILNGQRTDSMIQVIS